MGEHDDLLRRRKDASQTATFHAGDILDMKEEMKPELLQKQQGDGQRQAQMPETEDMIQAKRQIDEIIRQYGENGEPPKWSAQDDEAYRKQSGLSVSGASKSVRNAAKEQVKLLEDRRQRTSAFQQALNRLINEKTAANALPSSPDLANYVQDFTRVTAFVYHDKGLTETDRFQNYKEAKQLEEYARLMKENSDKALYMRDTLLPAMRQRGAADPEFEERVRKMEAQYLNRGADSMYAALSQKLEALKQNVHFQDNRDSETDAQNMQNAKARMGEIVRTRLEKVADDKLNLADLRKNLARKQTLSGKAAQETRKAWEEYSSELIDLLEEYKIGTEAKRASLASAPPYVSIAEIRRLRELRPQLDTSELEDLYRVYLTKEQTSKGLHDEIAGLAARISSARLYQGPAGKENLKPEMVDRITQMETEKELLRQHRPETLRLMEEKVDDVRRGMQICDTGTGTLTTNYRKMTKEAIRSLASDDEAFRGMSINEAEELAADYLKTMVSQNEFAMRVPLAVVRILAGKNPDVPTDEKMKNTFEVHNRSGGYINARYGFAEAKFGRRYVTHDSQYEKYGYLESEKGARENTSFARSYGEVKFKLKKENLQQRTTFTYGDSLNLKASAQPSFVDRPSLASIPDDFKAEVLQNAMSYKREKEKAAAEGKPEPVLDSTGIMNASASRYTSRPDAATYGAANYFELQYHGDVTLNDVDTITFYAPRKRSKTTGKPEIQTVGDLLNEHREEIRVFLDKGINVTVMRAGVETAITKESIDRP